MSFLGWVGVSVEERDGHGVWMRALRVRRC